VAACLKNLQKCLPTLAWNRAVASWQSEHVSRAGSAKKPLGAPTYFCNRRRSPLHNLPLRSIVFLQLPLTAPLCSTRFSAQSTPRSAPTIKFRISRTVCKLIAQFIVKMCNDKNLLNKFRPTVWFVNRTTWSVNKATLTYSLTHNSKYTETSNRLWPFPTPTHATDWSTFLHMGEATSVVVYAAILKKSMHVQSPHCPD